MDNKKYKVKLIMGFLLIFIIITILNSCVKNEISKISETKNNNIIENDVIDNEWEKILEKAKGTTVNFYGWGGSEQTNNWIDNILAPYAKENYKINVNRIPMNIDEILNKLLSDKENKIENGNVDLIWINGENFANAKENDLLYGPFTDKLPNFKKYINPNDDEIKYDFATLVEGYESPYGKAQFVLIADKNVFHKPPLNADELLAYCKNNPGKFTYEALPGFTGSAFVRNIIYEKVGYEKLAYLPKEITKEEVKIIIKPAIDYLIELNKYLWQEGKTFPATIEILDGMFIDGVLDFSMSYNPYYVATQIENGQYPDSIISFVFENGTIGNTNYVAIGFNSSNVEGAMCLADAILSVPMQSSKMEPKVWGTLPVCDMSKLNSEELKIFDSIPVGKGSLSQSELLAKRKPELPAYLVTIIEDIWEEEVLGK